MLCRPIALGFALGCSAAAQGGTIYVVDAANGPGANFADVQAAVDAVPDGSTLLVRPGTYAAITIDGKGLTILGDPLFMLAVTTQSGLVTVQNTAPQQRVLLRGFRDGNPFSDYSLIVRDAAGPVTMDGEGQTLSAGIYESTLSVFNSPQVHLRNWNLGSLAGWVGYVTLSTLVLERCEVRGSNAVWTHIYSGVPALPALVADASTIQLVDTLVIGGDGAFHAFPTFTVVLPGAPAIQMTNSSLRAAGPMGRPITGGTTPFSGQLPAIAGGGYARVDVSIAITAPTTGVSLTQPILSTLLADSALPGGSINARRYGPPGRLCAVAIGLRSVSSLLPGVVDPIWLDPTALIVEAVGITPTTGPFTVTKNVPNVAGLRGLEFVWQAADIDVTGVVEVSNPSPSFVR